MNACVARVTAGRPQLDPEQPVEDEEDSSCSSCLCQWNSPCMTPRCTSTSPHRSGSGCTRGWSPARSAPGHRSLQSLEQRRVSDGVVRLRTGVRAGAGRLRARRRGRRRGELTSHCSVAPSRRDPVVHPLVEDPLPDPLAGDQPARVSTFRCSPQVGWLTPSFSAISSEQTPPPPVTVALRRESLTFPPAARR